MTDEYSLRAEKVFLEDGSIPVLLLHGEPKTPRKAVLVLHGRSHSKEYIRTGYRYGAALARRGYLVASFDSYAHGERPGPEGASWHEIALRTAGEVPRIVDYLLAREDVFGDGIALIGGSMGGVGAYLSLLLEPRIRAAVIYMSSPVKLGQFSAEIMGRLGDRAFAKAEDYLPPAELLEAAPPAILMQIGGQDPGFSVASARQYAGMLAPFYAKCPEKLRLQVDEGLGHETTPEMPAQIVEWIETFFSSPPADRRIAE